MPEIVEVNVFRYWIRRFIDHARANLPIGDLSVQALFTDVRDSELGEMEAREQRLLEYGATFKIEMLQNLYHTVWATRLCRLADSVPDTHGLLIPKVWATFPAAVKSQISPNHCIWSEFCAAIAALRTSVFLVPDKLPLPWFRQPTAANFKFDLPSKSRLVSKMSIYSQPTWRGPNPDRRPAARVPPPPDVAWEDPIQVPSSIACLYPSPRPMRHTVHGDVFSPVAPPTLALAGSARTIKNNEVPSGRRVPSVSRGSRRQPKPKDKVSSSETLLTLYRFTAANKKKDSAAQPTVAGVSAHLASLGVKRRQVKPDQCTERDIDHSLFLYPVYLFPFLAKGQDISECGLELTGIHHDSRSLILDMGSCCVEIEPLLHTSPQIFANFNWEELVRVPADSRGFKIVIAFQMKTYTLAFLSHDNLCYIYWYSRADVELARAARVPDVIFEYWAWCKYVVHWLKDQDSRPRWDSHPLSHVLSMPGHHPFRGVGRYTSDELAWTAGKLTHEVRSEILAQCKRLNKLCGVNAQDADSSFLLITTQDAVLRYNRTLSVHKQLQCSMSNRKKELVSQYNRLSLLSHQLDPAAVMRDAPWPFDVADIAGALLLPGHMGPAIVPNWDELVASEGLSATTAEMRSRYETKLPSELSPLQHLAFKPVVDMTAFEMQMLSTSRGSAVNPVVDYFNRFDCYHSHGLFPLKARATHSLSPLDYEDEDDDDDILFGGLPSLTDSESESDGEPPQPPQPPRTARTVDRSLPEACETGEHYASGGGKFYNLPLSLIRDATAPRQLPTILYKNTLKPVFYTWTPLRLLKVPAAAASAYRPAGSSTLFPCEDDLRSKKTLTTVKRTTKLYTVGPMDFCGHAKAVRRGRGWVISLCRWDPTLDDKDQQYIQKSWEALGAWPKGFRKDKRKLVKKAVAFKAAAKKLLVNRWTLTRAITDDDVVREVSRQKALHREAAYQKALQKAADAAVKDAKRKRGKAAAKFKGIRSVVPDASSE
ncbi:hypothetical protein K438DRAFT_1973059 [Mycena galopus ATCC 62051]|nr:hypothetical protein K438DRAFT_1973059 [Mycena galopus ATCC 62051]